MITGRTLQAADPVSAQGGVWPAVEAVLLRNRGREAGDGD